MVEAVEEWREWRKWFWYHGCMLCLELCNCSILRAYVTYLQRAFKAGISVYGWFFEVQVDEIGS